MRSVYRRYIIIALIILIAGCGKSPGDDPTPEPEPPKPSISRFAPVADTIGATVTIYGSNFNPNTINNGIQFNGVSATVLTASTDSLTTKVPVGASTGKISVTIGGKIIETSTPFTVLYAPSITSFSPMDDSVGATVTIKGINFGNTPDKNIVSFQSNSGPVQAQVLQATETELVVKVPAGAGSSGKLKVKVNNYEATSAIPFYVLVPPVITSFAPFAGPPGSVITLTGTGLSQYTGGSIIIRFNGIPATQFQRFITTVDVVVPAGATTGKISMTIGTVTGTSTTDFIISSQLWTKKKDLATARYGAIGFSIGNKGYVGLGKQFNNDVALKDLWEYDPVTDVWTRKADLPTAGKWGSSCFVVNGKAYMVGGLNGEGGGNSFETWEYDPAQDKWTQKAAYPSWFHILPVAFSIGDKGYYGLGSQTELWQFDPVGNAWTQMKNFPGEERDGAMVFVIGNKAYMAGGDYDFNPMNDVWEYNPSNDSWTRKANWPGTLRNSGVGFSIGTNGYIGIGQTGPLGAFLKDLWEYNSITDTWIRKVDFPFEGRPTATSFVINGKAYVGMGGTPFKFYRDLWEFTP